MKTALEEIVAIHQRLSLAREIILRTPTKSEPDILNRSLDAVYGYLVRALDSLNEILEEEQE